MSDITRILSDIERGEPQAADQLLPLVYDELRRLAAWNLARERPGQTLDATALVHEAYLRLVATGKDGASARANRAGTTAGTSSPPPPRRCAASWSRTPAARGARSTAAGGGASTRTSTPSAPAGRRRSSWPCTRPWSSSRLHDPLKAKLVELRFFGGLTLEQAAACLDISLLHRRSRLAVRPRLAVRRHGRRRSRGKMRPA